MRGRVTLSGKWMRMGGDGRRVGSRAIEAGFPAQHYASHSGHTRSGLDDGREVFVSPPRRYM